MSSHSKYSMIRLLAVVLAVCFLCTLPATAQEDGEKKKYTKEEVMDEANKFFEGTTQGLAELVEKIFEDHGEPVGFIKGEEFSVAFVGGVRYGKGIMYLKAMDNRKCWWQGPSVGLDFGGNASKCFTLVYGMTNPDQIYRRYPGVEGSAYLVGGFGMNYQKNGPVVLAPIRTGVGLRLGANVGYLHYTAKMSYNPF